MYHATHSHCEVQVDFMQLDVANHVESMREEELGQSRDTSMTFDRKSLPFGVLVVKGYSKIHQWLRKYAIRTPLILSQNSSMLH